MSGLSGKSEASYRRYLSGDRSAAAEIMEEHFYGLVYFIDRYVHDVHAAEDIAMDVMSDLFVGRRGYNFKASLKTYLFMRGRSKALDLLRRRKTLIMTELDRAEQIADEQADLEERVTDTERKRALLKAINDLPEDMREAVHLIYFEELSYEEAARVMKKNKKQVDNLLYRAKKELRLLLKEELYEGIE